MILPPHQRGDLTNAQWQRLKPLLPPQKPSVGRPNNNHRTTINGILWILRTGAPWRDLPERYGAWGSVSGRFYRWRRSSIWHQVLQSLQQQADAQGNLNWEVHHVDGSVICAHQHAAGAKRGRSMSESLLSDIEQVQRLCCIRTLERRLQHQNSSPRSMAMVCPSPFCSPSANGTKRSCLSS